MNTEKSRFASPGPVRMLRPALPRRLKHCGYGTATGVPLESVQGVGLSGAGGAESPELRDPSWQTANSLCARQWKRTMPKREVRNGEIQRVLNETRYRETTRRIRFMNLNRKFCGSAGILLVAIGSFVIAGSRRASAAPPRPASEVEVPKFAVDPSWPHIPGVNP